MPYTRPLGAGPAVRPDPVGTGRRERVAEYLRRSDYSVREVACALGFAEMSSFNRAFCR
jgi:transcriptional regulator GlxA family with amidase domain